MDPTYNFAERILQVVGALASIIGVFYLARIAWWKRRLTWSDSLRTAKSLLTRIEAGKDTWDPEVVIGIGRSGGIWGGWIAGNLNTLPFGVVDVKYTKVDEKIKKIEFPGGSDVLDAMLEAHSEKKKMLIIEGATTNGSTFKEFKSKFDEKLKQKNVDYKLAVLYKNPASIETKIDFCGLEGPEPWPRKFPWHFTDRYRPYLRDIFN
ncbi:hypothetical protein KKC97_09905 [bacterium]|nr:hypothetical protein [bacterium]MBU1637966.1 hypothetical protein [bacterium]